MDQNPDLYYYNNPENIQIDILESMDKVFSSDTEQLIVNPNTTVGFLIDSFSNITGSMVKGIEQKFNSLYPRRAQNITELYNHISDYDYVSFQAQPASYKINIKMSKESLRKTAVHYNQYYNMLVIPRTSSFKIGSFSFGLYHDIFIKINKATNTIILNYDTNIINPLNSLNNYNIPYSEFNYLGVEYISFEITIYQFNTTNYTESIDNSIGFTKSYHIQDQFYAARVYDLINNFEFKYSYSDQIYDPLNPTVIIKSIPDENKVDLYIPSVYFSNGNISSQLKIDIFTTKGKLDINIDTTNADLIAAEFLSDDVFVAPYLPYITPLKHIENLIFVPLNNKLIGGKNVETFEEVKDRVIHNLFSNRVLISEEDIHNFFAQFDFTVIQPLDNLTKRIFYILSTVSDKVEYDKIQIANSKLIFDLNKLDTYPTDTIKNIASNKYVFLPSTEYNYNLSNDIIIPLTQLEKDTIDAFTQEQKVDYYNATTNLFTPYHLLVETNLTYPKASSFDLISCDAEKLLFDVQHPYTDYQIYINDIKLEHLNSGTGGYKLSIGVEKNVALKKVDEADLFLYLTIVTASMELIGAQMVYSETIGQMDIYTYNINTNYHLSTTDIRIEHMEYQPGYLHSVAVPLETGAHITLYVRKNIVTTNPNYIPYELFDGVELSSYFVNLKINFFTGNWVALTKFDFDLKLGTNLSDIIDNNITITYSDQSFQTYQTDVPLLYEHDIYDKDIDGKLIYQIVGGGIVLNKLHTQGDPVLDAGGDPVYKYRIGDIILNASGQPIIAQHRNLICTIDMFGLNYVYKFNPEFNIPSILNTFTTYYDIIKEHRNKLYGNTLCFFKPTSTLGIGKFIIDELTEDLNISISIGFKIYLNANIVGNLNTINLIRVETYKLIKQFITNNKTITIMDLGDKIKESFSDFISSVDTTGINSNLQLQTITKVDKEKTLSIKPILKLDDVGNIQIEDSITLEFLSATAK